MSPKLRRVAKQRAETLTKPKQRHVTKSAAETEIALGAAQVDALHRLVDAMNHARFTASMTKLLDQGHPEELTRTELSAKQIEFRKAARTGLADQLSEEATKRADSILRDWLNVERMYFDVVLGRNLKEVAAECWKILGDSPPEPPTDEELEDPLPTDIKLHLDDEWEKRPAPFLGL